MKGRKDSKSTSVILTTNDRSLQTVLSTIDQLFDMRLIQHISMPVDKDKKLSLISKFREKMNYLHNLLKEIQKDGWKEVETLSTRDKSKSRSGVESKVDELQRDQVRKVEIAYNQFFIEGSFKYYKKVAAVFGLPNNLQPIDMANWARNYKNQGNFQTQCCCQGFCCN